MAVSFSETKAVELLEAVTGYSETRAHRRQAAIDFCVSAFTRQPEAEGERLALNSAKQDFEESTERLL